MNIRLKFFSIVRRLVISKKTNKFNDMTQLIYLQPSEFNHAINLLKIKNKV